MADNDRTFSESELTAIVADRVERETADVTAERDQLKTEKDDLAAQLDVATSAREAADQKATDAEKALEDFRASIETEREMAARKDARLAAVREAAAHLKDEFFTDDRVTRIVAMSDESFEGYVGDMAETAKGVSIDTTPTGAPRESAMETGNLGSSPAGTATAATRFFNPLSAVKEA